jgi:hypothetical protein
MSIRSLVGIFFLWILVVIICPVQAQFLGHNAKGDFGLLSGTQPDPGFYFAPMYYRIDADDIKDRFGNSFRPDIPGSLDANAYLAGVWYVSDFKILGGNYGFMVFPGFTDNTFEVPILGVDQRSSTGFVDIYFQPLNLGWKTEKIDFTAGLGITAPTGRYDPEASDNLGLGMWSFEPYFGTTIYFDEAKSWHFATTAFYEFHTKKKDTDIKVGDILTLEGGLGKNFMEGAISVGAAYFAQLKITDDELGLTIPLPEGVEIGKNRVFGIGPDVTIPIMTKTTFIAALNVRYFWDIGARTTLEGRTFVITATFPIPSVKLP